MLKQLRRAPFQNRMQAGRALARKLIGHASRPDRLVLALRQGSVPVAFEVAQALQLPLDLFLVQKLGLPGSEPLSMGAISSGGVRVLNRELLRLYHVAAEVVDAASARALRDLEARERLYRGDRPAPCAADRVVILVDDGLATCSTVRAAVRALRRQDPKRIVVAFPIADSSTWQACREEVEEVLCAAEPEPFVALSRWYEDCSLPSEGVLRELLGAAAPREEEHALTGKSGASSA